MNMALRAGRINMDMKEFLEKNDHACREGRAEGECFATVEEWWDYTGRADFMAWVLAVSDMGDLEICKQLYEEIKPDLEKHGLTCNVYGMFDHSVEPKLEDYLYSFYNYDFFNMRDPKWADRMRELMGNPFREESYKPILGSHVDEAVAIAFEIAVQKNIVVAFTFNDTIVRVARYSKPKLIARDLSRCNMGYRSGPVGPSCAENLTEQEIESDRIIERQREAARKAAKMEAEKEQQKRLELFEETYKGIVFECSNQEAYDEWFEANADDPYGTAMLNFAVRWARAMQVNSDRELACGDADIEGITGFMYGGAVTFLARCWVGGNDLRKWHNSSYNVESDGVVNPAIFRIEGPL